MDSDGGGPETVCCETLLRWRGQGETILLRSEISCQVCFMVSMETNSDMFKGWMMRQIFFWLIRISVSQNLSESNKSSY